MDTIPINTEGIPFVLHDELLFLDGRQLIFIEK
jgi:hypothetical protein